MGPTSEVAIVNTRFLRKTTLVEVSKPLMIIKAWICLRVTRLGIGAVVPILFLIMMLIFFVSIRLGIGVAAWLVLCSF